MAKAGQGLFAQVLLAEWLDMPGAVVKNVLAVPSRLWAQATPALNSKVPASSAILSGFMSAFLPSKPVTPH
jgi:hypothetical protein